MKNKFIIPQKNSIPGIPTYRNSFSGTVKNQLSEDLFEKHPVKNLTEKAESEAITLMKLFTICTLFFYSLFFLMLKIPYLLFFTKLTTGRHQVSIKKNI